MLAELLRNHEPEQGDVWWVWHTWCAVDPLVIHCSVAYPHIDEDGYWKGKFIPACMTRPVQIRAHSRWQAIGLYKWALAMYQDYRRGKALSGQ